MNLFLSSPSPESLKQFPHITGYPVYSLTDNTKDAEMVRPMLASLGLLFQLFLFGPFCTQSPTEQILEQHSIRNLT